MNDAKHTLARVRTMSAFPPKADIRVTRGHVCLGPQADMHHRHASRRSGLRKSPQHTAWIDHTGNYAPALLFGRKGVDAVPPR